MPCPTGKIIEFKKPVRCAARVQFGEIVRQVSLSFVPEAGVGRLRDGACWLCDQPRRLVAAERTYKVLEAMGELEAELAPAGE